MPSSKNLIQSLRSAHDPHFKLEGKVGGLEKGLGIEVAKLHKTLSKSFAMQRKTLVRVLGLEGRVSELESQQAAEEQAREGIDETLDEMRGEDGYVFIEIKEPDYGFERYAIDHIPIGMIINGHLERETKRKFEGLAMYFVEGKGPF